MKNGEFNYSAMKNGEFNHEEWKWDQSNCGFDTPPVGLLKILHSLSLQLDVG